MYDKPENAQLSRRERVFDPLSASNKSDAEKKEANKEGSFYGYKDKSRNYEHGLDD